MSEVLSSTVFLVAMGVWLGGVVFFSFFTAPVIFERLSRDQAADLISVLFPRYYNLGYACGSLMVLAGAWPVYLNPTGNTVGVEVLAMAALAVSLYAGRVVMPRVRRRRHEAASSAGTPGHADARDAYGRAHQLSVALNSAVLLLLVAEALLYGYRVRSDFLS